MAVNKQNQTINIIFNIIVENGILNKNENLLLKVDDSVYEMIPVEMSLIRHIPSHQQPIYQFFKGESVVQREEIGYRIYAVDNNGTEKKLKNRQSISHSDLSDVRFDNHYHFETYLFGDGDLREAVKSISVMIWSLNDAKEKIENFIGFCKGFKDKQVFWDIVLDKMSDGAIENKQRILTEFIETLVLLTGVTTSSCKSDKFLFQLCKSLTLLNCYDKRNIVNNLSVRLEGFFEIIFDSLKIFWEDVKKKLKSLSSSMFAKLKKSDDPEWLHPLLLVILFTEKSQGRPLDDFEIKGLISLEGVNFVERSHIRPLLEQPSRIVPYLELSHSLQYFFVMEMYPIDYLLLLEISQFDVILIIDAIGRHIEKSTLLSFEADNVKKCLINVKYSEENGSQILVAFLRVLNQALKKLNWRVHKDIYSWLLSNIQLYSSISIPDNEVANITRTLNDIIESLPLQVERAKEATTLLDQFQIFNNFISLNIGNVDMEPLIEASYKELNSYLDPMVIYHPYSYVNFYNNLDLDKYCDKLQRLLFIKVQDTLVRGENIENSRFMKMFFESSNASKVLLNEIKEEWNKNSKNELLCTTEKVFSTLYLKICLQKFDKITHDGLRGFLADISKSLCFKHSLTNILLADARVILEYRNDFTEIYKNSVNKVCPESVVEVSVVVESKIAHLQRIVSCFDDTFKAVRNIILFLRKENFVINHFYECLLKEDFGNTPVSDFSSPMNMCTLFQSKGLDLDFVKTVNKLDILSKKVFLKIIKAMPSKGIPVSESNLTFMIDEVIKPVFLYLENWLTKIFLKENITIYDTNKIFDDMKIHEIESELKSYINFFAMVDGSLTFLLYKIEILRDLQHISNLAKSIMNISDGLGMRNIERVKKIYEEREALNKTNLCDVTEELLKPAAWLFDVGKNQEKLLKSLSSGCKLICWIKETFEDQNGNTNFINIVKNCAQTPMEVDIVLSFDVVCNGLKEILFSSTSKAYELSTFLQMSKLCSDELSKRNELEVVCNAIDTSSQYLVWFKSSLESVDKKTFTKVQEINKSGCFVIHQSSSQYLQDKNDSSLLRIVFPAEDIYLKLENGLNSKPACFENNKLTDKSNIKYEEWEIDDLQSLLILLGQRKMVEENAWEKMYFTNVYSFMKNLSKTYQDLIKVGCLEYFNIQYVFKCNIMETSKDVFRLPTAEIDELSLKVHSFEEKMIQMRYDHPLLNYISSKQCVMLRKYLPELLRGTVDKKLQYQIVSILSTIDENITVEQLKTFLGILSTGESLLPKVFEHNRNQIERFPGMSENDIYDFIEELLGNGISEDMAYASLICVEPLTQVEAHKWCLNTYLDEEEKEKLADESKAYVREMSSGCDDGPQADEILMEEHIVIEERASSNSHGVLQELSLEQLVDILEKVNYASGRKLRNVKSFFFKENQPYLIAVKKEKIVEVVLDIYFKSCDSLPEYGDLLFCNKDTNKEEIEMLVRRAMVESKGIFSLMFVDELNYRISQEVIAFIQGILKEDRLKNPLLIFCSKEKEYNNLFMSTFQPYQFLLNLNTNSEMVQEKFKVFLSKSKCSTFLASEVFPQSSSCLAVSSKDSGMGKSYQVQQMADKLKEHILQKNMSANKITSMISVPVVGNHVDIDHVIDMLLTFEAERDGDYPVIYHFDISPTVVSGLESFLFSLIVLSMIKSQNGVIWKKKPMDAIVLEVTLLDKFVNQNKIHLLKMLPTLKCEPPTECIVSGSIDGKCLSKKMFESEQYQRVYQYLLAFNNPKSNLSNIEYEKHSVVGDPASCLQLVIRHTDKKDPSWIELSNFVKFFNLQLDDCEKCVYCKPIYDKETWRTFLAKLFKREENREMLKGFKMFVIRLFLKMSKDFVIGAFSRNKENDMPCVELSKKWKNNSHPYLFFNEDRSTFSFLGFKIDEEINLVDSNDPKKIIEEKIMPLDLYNTLNHQFEADKSSIRFDTNFNSLKKNVKLELMCRVMGVTYFDGIDPDNSFVLTNDNVQKILAIHMRLRANIPVILCGETGCGKTELIKYMAALLKSGIKEKMEGEKLQKNVQNLLLAKIHGGTTYAKVKEYLDLAISQAKKNVKHNVDTILFFDECNTSEAVGLIKEIMVDGRCFGNTVDFKKYCLKIVAAVNPYRRHSDDMIEKLENSGLGYFNKDGDVEHLGKYPLRHLVYRVLELPESMMYYVMDYGELDEKTEKEYIKEMVKKERVVNFDEDERDVLVRVLAFSQQYMRRQKDESRFVSLRDVERALKILIWFRSILHLLIDLQGKQKEELFKIECLLSLSVCYIYRLDNRQKFIHEIPDFNEKDMQEIEGIQRETVKKILSDRKVALNKALCENMFMMFVCIELRIPLFVVGKPGCSKSFAKSIIEECMQGKLSSSEFCANFKQVFMASYQCSILSTAEGIISTFGHCRKYQESRGGDDFVATVVLDEVGLAEASPKMPLKALHPLLEDGTDNFEGLAIDERKENIIRPAFIGLSNFAIDPAKVNRGILLNHPTPDEDELQKTGWDLCKDDENLRENLKELIRQLTKCYKEVYEKQRENPHLKKFKKPEFFGLRDYYSLIKEVFCIAKTIQGVPDFITIKVIIQRNFSGLQGFNTLEIFRKGLKGLLKKRAIDLPDVLKTNLIEESLNKECSCLDKHMKRKCFNSRYLLLMTEEYAALGIVVNDLLKDKDNVEVIFGSSFPNDEQFSKVCRDVTRIKLCMEEGKKVVLLNMENLYESLYDALNQHYVYFGGQKYVNLGLGVHRVKCRVHDDFKLVVIADVEKVYKEFPIPLINRLEKHFLLPSWKMNTRENRVYLALEKWTQGLALCGASSSDSANSHSEKLCETFPGFNENTIPAVVSRLSENTATEGDLFVEARDQLIHSATPDAMVRYLERNTEESIECYNEYFKDSRHFSLMEYIQWLCHIDINGKNTFSQVTTYSRALTDLPDDEICFINLQDCQMEISFREKLNTKRKKFIVIQCVNVNNEQNRINFVKYICTEFYKSEKPLLQHPLFFILILQLSQSSIKLKGWQGNWVTVHIDELKSSQLSVLRSHDKTFSDIFRPGGQLSKTILQITSFCIQAAVEELNHAAQMDFDTINQKIKILQESLSYKNSNHIFSNKLLEHIKSGIEAEEKIHLFEEGSSKVTWMRHQAKEHYRQANYSFDQFLIKSIEEKIKPLLTSFLKKCDCNNNLLLLNSVTKNIWMVLFEANVFVNLHDHPSDSSFSCRFPFSLQMINLVDKMNISGLFTENSSNEKSKVEHAKKMNLQKMADAFAEFLPSVEVHNEERNYIHDLFCIKLPKSDERFTELLVDVFVHEMENLPKEVLQKCDQLCYLLACVHDVFERFKRRLSLATKIYNLKNIKLKYIDVNDGAEGEMTGDMQIMERFLDERWPNKKFDLIKSDLGKKWSSLLKEFKPHLEFTAQHKDTFGELSTAKFKSIRLKWTKLRIFQLFIENAVESYDEFDEKYVSDFFKDIVQLKDTLENDSSWAIVDKAIMKCFDNFKEEHEQIELVKFKNRMNSLYVILLNEFCFDASDGFKIDKKIEKTLIQNVFSAALNESSYGSSNQRYRLDEKTFKSFIVMQLLRKKWNKELFETVDSNLNEALKSKNLEDYWTMTTNFLFSVEDATSILNSRASSKNSEIHMSQVLGYINDFKNMVPISSTTLERIGKIRYGLSAACAILFNNFLKEKQDKTIEKEIDPKEPLNNLITSMKRFCNDKEAHYFCLRYLLKAYGFRTLKEMMTKYNWLPVHGMEVVEVNVDVFLVYGDEYRVFRDEIKHALINKNSLQELLEIIEEFADNAAVKRLLEDTVLLTDKVQQDWLKELLIHLEVVKQSDSVAAEYINLIFDWPAETLRNFYLLGMPSDRFEEIKRRQISNASWETYECSKGHSSVIEVQTWVGYSYKCSQCNENIGNSYGFAKNAVYHRDTTKTGYCGGYAKDRPADGISERELDSRSVALIRFLVDLCFYKLSLVDAEKAARSVTLPSSVADVTEFFKEHVEASIKTISSKLAPCKGDGTTILHMFLKHIQESHWNYGETNKVFQYPDHRRSYEREFSNEVVEPFIEKLKEQLKEVHEKVLYDVGKGKNDALNKLFEITEEKQVLPNPDKEESLNNQKLWEYNPSISFSHFKKKCEEAYCSKKSFLYDFLQKEEELELVKNLPDLIELQNILIKMYNYKYSRQAIKNMKARSAITKGTSRLFKAFNNTWNIARKYLVDHGRFPIPDDAPKVLSENSSLAYYICSTSGYGQCARALIDYLAFLQDNILRNWESSDCLKLNRNHKVELMNITETDVINYTRDRDLTTLLFSFSQYMTDADKGVVASYDFESIEKYLIEKTCVNGALIDINIKYLIYHDDVKASKNFNFFTEAVPQSNISHEDLHVMCQELKNTRELERSLEAIQTSIAFLSVTHGDSEMRYDKFISNVLLMNIDIYIGSCKLRNIRLKHLTSAWLALTVEHAIRLHVAGKLPFKIDEEYQVDIGDGVTVEKNIENHKRKSIIDLLTEFIIFKVTELPNPDTSLFEALRDHEIMMEKNVRLITENMLKFNIKVKHCFSLWKRMVELML